MYVPSRLSYLYTLHNGTYVSATFAILAHDSTSYWKFLLTLKKKTKKHLECLDCRNRGRPFPVMHVVARSHCENLLDNMASMWPLAIIKRDALTAQECIIEFVWHTDECSHLHRRQVGTLANTCPPSLNSVPLNSTKITENDTHLEHS